VTETRLEQATKLVVEVFNEFDQCYGYRKICEELARRGHTVSEHTVRRIMATEQLVACHPRQWRVTTDSGNDSGVNDHLKGDFTADAPGTRFVGDITYIKTWAGWLYLATVIDLYSREVVGYSMASNMKASLIVNAMEMAVANRRVNATGAVFHSDRGGQYFSTEFMKYCNDHGITQSMGRTGVCWDNAAAESFFATLKKECVHRCVFPTRRHAVKAITKYIEVFYNRKRIHSSIGYNTPLEVRQAWENNNRAA